MQIKSVDNMPHLWYYSAIVGMIGIMKHTLFATLVEFAFLVSVLTVGVVVVAVVLAYPWTVAGAATGLFTLVAPKMLI